VYRKGEGVISVGWCEGVSSGGWREGERRGGSGLGIGEEFLPCVGVHVGALVGVEGAMGDVGGVFTTELDVFGCEAEEMGTVDKAMVGGGGVPCSVVCEVEGVEVDEAEGDVGGQLVKNEVMVECVTGGIARGDVEVMVGESLGNGAGDQVWNGVGVVGTKRA